MCFYGSITVVRTQDAPVVFQGCREFLQTGFLLTNDLQITPVVSGFLYDLLQTGCTNLKVAALTML
jgi:hypothetical protein